MGGVAIDIAIAASDQDIAILQHHRIGTGKRPCIRSVWVAGKNRFFTIIPVLLSV
jgi:hypothetical protein